MTNNTILITGTSSGIGMYLADYFSQNGDNLVIGCSRKDSPLQHENYCHYNCDVTQEQDIDNMLLSIRKQYKKIDVLINNAGIASMNHFLLTPVETARKVMEVNYFGSFMCSQKFSRLLRKSQHPRIINFSTVAVPLDLAGESAYAASKSAVVSLTKTLAKELSQYGITVNAVGPTPVKTNLIANVPEKKIEALLSQQAIHRLGTPEDVLNVIKFFIKPESDFITGQVIYLGGVS